MSKQQTRRKITLDSSLKQVHSNPTKDTQRRPSVFERLGTKAISNSIQCPTNVKPTESFCRQWEQNGTCQYGKSCKYVSTHALISPSKRAAIKDASSKINNKSCSSSSSSGSSSTGSDSTSSQDSSSSGSSESVESSRHHRHKAKHISSRKLKGYSSSSDKEHAKRNNLRTGKGASPSKKSSHPAASVVDVATLHRDMKHSKKRRSRDRSDGRASPRKAALGVTSVSKKSLSPPVRGNNTNSDKHRSQSPLLKGGKLAVQTSKLGLNSRNIGAQLNARTPPSHKGSRERERNREKEEREREREIEKEKEREKERDRESKKLRERELEKQREREKERDKDRNRSRSPKVKVKDIICRSPRKEVKRKESPDPHHSKPGRLSGGSLKGRDDISASLKHKAVPGDNWHRKDDKEEERKRLDERRHKEARLLPGHNEKDHIRERDRERERVHERERDKDKSKSLQQGIPSLLTLNLHPNDFNAHIASGVKERAGERNRSLERTGLLRNLSIDRGRERSLDRVSERSRGSERDRRCRNNNGGLEKGLDHSGLEKELAKALARNREQDRTFERNERVPDRGLERGLERNADRGPDRGVERGLDRGMDRSLDRGLDRGLERGMDRNLKSERVLDRASPRVIDRDTERGLERGLDRDPVLGRLERGIERGLERGLERGSPRIERDHRFTERSPGDRIFGGTHIDHNREPDDNKGYDAGFEGRRERGRFSDQSRYDKGVPLNDERRMGPGDVGVFIEERRRGRDGNRQEPRNPGQWEARNDRKRDHIHERDHGRDHGPRAYDGGQRPSGKRNDWEWDGRGRRSGKEWEGQHRPDNNSSDKEWNRFPPGQGDWSGQPGDRRSGGWNDEWRSSTNQVSPAAQLLLNRPPGRMLPVRDDSQNASHKTDELVAEEGLKVKEQTGSSNDLKNDSKVDGGTETEANHSLNLKRTREAVDGDEALPDNKKLFLEKDAALEEVLSDISDDADEILNREDSELSQLTHGDPRGDGGKDNRAGNQQSTLLSHSNQPAGASHSHHRRTAEGGENAGNLGFEEISDGELEEEARARGISDALGVDWASLVAETRPRAKTEKAASTRQRWEGIRLLSYIGLSVEYAGPKLVKYILSSTLSPQAETSALITDSASKVEDSAASSSSKVDCVSGVKTSKQDVICDAEINSSEKVKHTDNGDGESHQSLSGTKEADKSEDPVTTSGKVEPSDSDAQKCISDSKPQVKLTESVKKGGGEESKAVSELQRKESVINVENPEKQICVKLLHPIAGIHAALLERKARHQALFSGFGPYKRALSARRDLAIRRQLCSLPPRETTCDNGPAVDELFRLSVQLLERAS